MDRIGELDELPLEEPPADWFIEFAGRWYMSPTFDAVADGKVKDAFHAWMVATTNSELDPAAIGTGHEDPQQLAAYRRRQIEENAPIVRELSGFSPEQLRAQLKKLNHRASDPA